MNQRWSAYLFVFGGHHSHVWQWTTLLMVLLSNITFFSWSFLTVEDLSRRRMVDVPDSNPILWSWFKPIPWSCSSIISLVSSKPPTSSNVFHLPSASSFVSFSFFFEYFSKSSLIFSWSGWWLFRTYKSCFETEHRSRFGSSYVQRLCYVLLKNVCICLMFMKIPQQSKPFVVCASEEQLSFSWFLIFGTVVWLSFFEQVSSLQELCSF